MMNWYQQNQDMMKTWMDMQQQMMNSMTQSASKPQEMGMENWAQTLQAWENAFKNAMESQALLTRMWARNMTTGMTPEAAETFTKSVEQMTTTWTEMQSMMLTNWFMVLKSMNPADMQAQSGTAMQQWQDSMQQMMDMQSEWAKKWMESMTPEAK